MDPLFTLHGNAAPRVLVLGHTGKLGSILHAVFARDCPTRGASASQGHDAGNSGQLAALLEEWKPQLVLNAVALNGLDACERDPGEAIRLNARLPQYLARKSEELGFDLVHFSTDAVFDGCRTSGSYVESDPASPIHLYGLTKFGGECFALAESRRCWIFRLSLLIGQSSMGQQFLEKMITRAVTGDTLRVSKDIVCSPSYVPDLVEAVRRHLAEGLAPGLYHLANQGEASLFDLTRTVVEELGLGAVVEPVTHEAFPGLARKNLHTPIRSERLPVLRPWQEAVHDYCRMLILQEGWRRE